MSIKIIDSPVHKNKNENAQKRILQRQNETQNHSVFPKPGTSSLLLSDKTEFPSLSESLERASDYSPSSRVSLKYSDKLKSPSSSRNQTSMPSNVHLKCNTNVTDMHKCDKISRSKFQNVNDKNKLDNQSKPDIYKQMSDYSLNKSTLLNNKKNTVEKNELVKQKPVLKSKLGVQNKATKASAGSSNGMNALTKQSNKSVSYENNELKEENNSQQENPKTKKKKKRKSKVKRQVALQSGKITFLTPEIHSKILNQTCTLNVQNSTRNSLIGNINDEEEYPELGKTSLPMSQKENFSKTNASECQVEAAVKPVNSSAERNVITENIINESPIAIASENLTAEKKDKNEKVHSLNSITISFYDMLIEKSIKKKEMKELKSKPEIHNTIETSKLKNKKNANHPHNVLDSSSPAVKRGKEREKPKPKKPSQLKKIILLDRKARRDHLLQMKSNDEESNITNENVFMHEPCEEENKPTISVNEEQLENIESDLSVLCDDETVLQLTEDSDSSVLDELLSGMAHLNISENINNCDTANDLSTFEEIIENNNGIFIEKSTLNLSLDERLRTENEINVTSQIDNQFSTDTSQVHQDIPLPPESILSSLTEKMKPDISDKERAAKILLHTRNFRQYCNHLISKDIDDVVYALLDDLARFQDRLHQKDPVKARMKKRMIYGVKEVKKYIKLRKLKCIIIAVDIENVEAQGGLNDILNEIKASAVDHHIPCVFALNRKTLGKVCHKPVPVSCVGVFNYEGSEVNFKKMVELQSQSKADYIEILNKLIMKVTDEEVATLIKAKKEVPETLREVRANILNNSSLLLNPLTSEDENIKHNEATSNVIDTTTL